MKKILIFTFLLIFISSCTQDPSIIDVDYSASSTEQAEQFADGAIRVLYSSDFNNVYPHLAAELIVWESDETYTKDSSRAREIYDTFIDYNAKYETYEEFKQERTIKVVSVNNVVDSGIFGDYYDSQEEFETRTIDFYGEESTNKIFQSGNYFVYTKNKNTGRVSDPFIVLTREEGDWKILSYPPR
jgi:hypothetical protein